MTEQSKVSDAAVVQRGDRVVYRKLAEGEGGVLLHLDTGAYHGINEFGAFVWEQIGPSPTVADLLTAMENEIDDAPSSWREEVASFLRELADRDLLSLDEPAPRTA